ncbi:MAG: DUF4058 family protein [Planctomycetes bacterium]|nr:DUF4058 family protein [Planctomycetota bacterium]
MDPFIEGCGLWADFHNHLIEKIGEALADAIPSQYLVRTGERSYLVLTNQVDDEAHSFIPDVSISSDEGEGRQATSAAAVAEPAVGSAPFSMRAFCVAGLALRRYEDGTRGTDVK